MASPYPLDFTVFHNVIDGRLSGTKQMTSSVNPSTLQENPLVPLSTTEDVDHAVQAARQAATLWAKTPWSERQEALKSFADALEGLSDEFVRMVVREQGKPVRTVTLRSVEC